MDLFQLETFLAVAEEKSFSRAALRLHRTQPAVSQVIGKLETELGESLFERQTGSLTDAGEVLRDYAVKLVNLRDEAGSALKELRSLHRGRLLLAANEYTCLCLLPLIHEYTRRHPQVKVEVQRSLASRIGDDVLANSVELGVLSFQPSDPQLRSVVIFRDELVCVVSPTHALARAGAATIKELGRERFVAHNIASPQRQRVFQAFAQHRTKLPIWVELPSLDAIKRFVAMGNGVALSPKLTVAAELRTGALVEVKARELNFERKLRIVYRKQTALSHTARAFLKIAEEYATHHGDPYYFQSERVARAGN